LPMMVIYFKQVNNTNVMNKSKKFEGQAHNYKPVRREQGLMSDAEYLAQRLDDQINWHKGESVKNKKKYSTLKVIDTVIAALVPLSIAASTVFPDISVEDGNHMGFWVTRGISVFSGIYVAISAGFFELERFESKWKDYERLFKKLEAEKYKYLSRAEPYDEDDAFPRLVFAVENYLHQDMMNFFKTQKKEHIEELEIDEEIADSLTRKPSEKTLEDSQVHEETNEQQEAEPEPEVDPEESAAQDEVETQEITQNEAGEELEDELP